MILSNTELTKGVISLENLGLVLADVKKSDYFIDCSTIHGRQQAYKKCDIVRSILGKSSSAIANLRVWALDENGKQVKTATSNEIISKLKQPNPKEDFKRFFRKLDIYCKLHGKAYVHKQKSLLGTTDYYVIPNEFITPYYGTGSNSLFERKIDYYKISNNTESYRLDTKDVHIFYDGILSSTEYEVFGSSRLESLSEAISCYVVIMEVLTELYGSGGARNIISMGMKDHATLTSSVTKDEKISLYARLAKNWGWRRNQSKDIVISSDAKVYPLTSKIIDMGIPESIKQSIKSIYTAYEWPAELASVETSRFKTLPEARKEGYTQSAIPTIEYYYSEWLNMIERYNLPFELMADFSHLDFYQEAQKEAAIAYAQVAQVLPSLTTNNIITIQEARVKLDLE